MIDFELSEEQTIMCEAVAQFAKSSISERVREFEASRAVADPVREAAWEMALGGIEIPESCGGQALGLRTLVLLEEELGRVDAAAAFGLPGPGAFGSALLELGSEPQQQELLAPFFASDGAQRFGAVAWSEAKPNKERPGFNTVAKRDGEDWLICGAKSFVIHAGLADRFVVFAQVDEAAGWNGLGAFVVMADSAGLTVGQRHETLGLDAAWFGEIKLEDVRVGAQARLSAADDFTRALLRFFCRRSLAVAARAVGLAQQAFDLAREYCDTRVAFGKPIGHFQAVAFNLADRLMDVESARWMLWRAAWSWDVGKSEAHALRDTAHAAAHALETAMRCADDCVSLHGGAGFIRDLVAEKLMRDAKQIALCCPTAEQLDQMATAAELGGSFDAALVLPTPDTQAIFV
jgi:alkylation response protein AidB-like acyl-CoA dehydrogenase